MAYLDEARVMLDVEYSTCLECSPNCLECLGGQEGGKCIRCEAGYGLDNDLNLCVKCDETKNEYFQNYLKQIYPAIIAYRNLDEVETA